MSNEATCDVGMVGLGVMGGNLALNFCDHGYAVAGSNLDLSAARALAAAHPTANLHIAESNLSLVAMLKRPRRIVLLVPAGAPVDAALDELDPVLEQDDVVVDGGNSLFTDTERRIARAADRPWRFVGMGVSGGADGARHGPAMMPGGDPEAWTVLQEPLERIAAHSEFGPCVAHCGRGSAGHFVKMVHNGIEYGDMQLIAETAALLRDGLELPASAVADTFAHWNEGELDSYLIEITADLFRVLDPVKADGSLLLDAVLDQAGQKGTGRWTVKAALDLAVAVPTIAAAVDARVLSAGKELREQGETLYGRPQTATPTLDADALKDALYAAKIASYTQGFGLLDAASQAHGYQTDLAEVARIWTAGCIIRARFLGEVRQAFAAESPPPLLAFAPNFVTELEQRIPALRRVVGAASHAGLAVPGLAASLTWFDTLTTKCGTANVIQAQRDTFGNHTYRRTDRPEEAVHTEWRKLAVETSSES